MKKLFLLGLVFSAGMGAANAQSLAEQARAEARTANHQQAPISLQATDNASGKKKADKANARTQQTVGSWGVKIGQTYYDLQTNSANGNRVHRNSDGTVSAVWTETCNVGGPAFNTRGIGYNYKNNAGTWVEGNNGTCDQTGADFGVASRRVGWPEIVVLPSGEERIFAHDGSGITVTTRPQKGTGGMAAWATTADIPHTKGYTTVNLAAGGTAPVTGAAPHNSTWPRVVASGNYIHMIYAVNNSNTTSPSAVNGITSPFVYSRFNMGTNTWDKQNVLLPGMDSVRFSRGVGGDAYAIHANGSTVAVTSGSFGQAWSVWKSTNDGDSWTRLDVKASITPADTIIFSSGDTTAVSNDASHAIVVDNGGRVHTWAGQILVKTEKMKAANTWYPLAVSGILYWNDAMTPNEPELIAVRQNIYPTGDPNDFVGNGSTSGTLAPYGTKSLTSMSSAAVDAANNIYLVYAGIVEGTSNTGTNTGQSYRDIYAMKSTNRGTSWTFPINVAGRIYGVNGGGATDTLGTDIEEEVYPTLARTVGSDNALHMIWQMDYNPGLSVNGDLDPEEENAIMYASFDVNFQPLLGVSKEVATFVNRIEAYPNPTSDKVMINVNLKKDANVSVKVTNLMGQEVANIAASAMTAGDNTVTVDLSSVASGIYMYTVTSDNFSVTQKVVKK